MTWPTNQVSTTNLDQGTDNPGLARPDLKQAVDNINAVVSEFGNVSLGSSVDGQVLTKSGNVWLGVTPTVYGNTQVAAYLVQNPQSGTYSNANVASYLTANPQPGTYGNTQVSAYLPTYIPNYTGVVPVGKYKEAAYVSGTTTGTVILDFNNGNQQVLNASGNITLGFTGAPAAATMSVIFNTGAASRSVTFANTAKYAGNVRTVSSTTNTTDIIVATTYDSGASYLISIVKGFV
jgi:hypothetical protein